VTLTAWLLPPGGELNGARGSELPHRLTESRKRVIESGRVSTGRIATGDHFRTSYLRVIGDFSPKAERFRQNGCHISLPIGSHPNWLASFVEEAR
jgi:hypothetical protein